MNPGLDQPSEFAVDPASRYALMRIKEIIAAGLLGGMPKMQEGHDLSELWRNLSGSQGLHDAAGQAGYDDIGAFLDAASHHRLRAMPPSLPQGSGVPGQMPHGSPPMGPQAPAPEELSVGTIAEPMLAALGGAGAAPPGSMPDFQPGPPLVNELPPGFEGMMNMPRGARMRQGSQGVPPMRHLDPAAFMRRQRPPHFQPHQLAGGHL